MTSEIVVAFFLGPISLLSILADGWMSYVTLEDPTRIAVLVASLLGSMYYTVILGTLSGLARS